MTLIMHILETYPPGFLSCPLRAGAGEMAPNYDESEISQVPGPGLERWDLMSAGRADRGWGQ